MTWRVIPDGGFTVLELMITLLIAAVLLVLGVPAMQNFGARQRMDAALSALHSDLVLARSSAIHLDIQTVVCPGDLPNGCSGSTDWSAGWIVFSDINADRQYQSLEPVIRQGAPVRQLAINGSAGRTTLRFFPNGSAPGSNSSIRFCDRRGPDHARKLVLSNLGRVRREEAPDTEWSDYPASGS